MSILGRKITHFPLLLDLIRMFLENTKLFTFTQFLMPAICYNFGKIWEKRFREKFKC